MEDSTPLLSRVADAVYWMARYIERAENIARYIGVNLNLQLDLPGNPAQQWQSLIDTSGDSRSMMAKLSARGEEIEIKEGDRITKDVKLLSKEALNAK